MRDVSAPTEDLLIQGLEWMRSPILQLVTVRNIINVDERFHIISCSPYGLTDGPKIRMCRLEAFRGVVNQTGVLKLVSYRHFPQSLYRKGKDELRSAKTAG